MTLIRIRRISLAVGALILASALLTGCASKSVKVKINPIPHADADDIAQVIGTTISADNGGWYLVIKRLADSLHVQAPLTSSIGAPNSFTITGGTGPIVYNVDMGFLRGDQTIATNRDTSSSDLLANVVCAAQPFINANGVNPGTYWMNAPDSALFVSNLQDAAPDTLDFSGSFEDSCLALVFSTVSGATGGRYWFVRNFVDFRMRIPKSNLVSAPYPVGSDSEVKWNIEAFGLKSNNPADWGFDDIIEIKMIFDGSPDAVLSLGDVLPDPNWVYYYKLNLNTGHITRLN